MTECSFTLRYYCDEVTVMDEGDLFAFVQRGCEGEERTRLFEVNRAAARRLHRWLGKRLAGDADEED
jgi:hypothetical protein